MLLVGPGVRRGVAGGADTGVGVPVSVADGLGELGSGERGVDDAPGVAEGPAPEDTGTGPLGDGVPVSDRLNR